jgi:hypothetical protein
MGIYFVGGGENWGFMGPTYYVVGKMLGDPSLDYRSLVKEYCDGMYGRGSAAMQNFFDVLYTRVCMEKSEGATLQDMQLLRYPPRFVLSLEEHLDTAEAAADGERERGLIRMTRDQLEFNKHTAFALLAYRNWKAHPTDASWQQVKASVDAYNAFRERVVRYDDAFAREYFPGYDRFCNYLTGGGYYDNWAGRKAEVLTKPLKGTVAGYSLVFNYPMTLNFDKPPKLGAMDVHRAAAPPKLDGKLDDAAWAASEAQELPSMALIENPARTTVRAVYDDESLYFAFECDEPFIDRLKTASTGRDGPVWRFDCGEILLGPDRSRRRYYHWIIAPTKDALYDDRTGFKTLKDQDPSWNSACEYAYAVDQAGKRWFLEVKIPFASMGVQAPRPGAWWLANFGRERRAHTDNTDAADSFYLWSQDESLGFCSPEAFGRIRFAD